MSSFLTNHGVVVALVCAVCAVVYGLLTTRSLLALSPGNERMQSISLAVQQGARAYLNRQYTTIAIVGVVVFGALISDPEHRRRVRLRDRRHPLRRGRLHRHERLRARQCPRRRGGSWRRLAGADRRLPRWRDHRPAGRRPRADGGRRLLRPAHRGLQRNSEDGRRCADRPRLRRLADLDLRASRRRHLHEGGRRRRRPRGQGRGRHPRGRPPQPRDDRRQRRRQRRRLRRDGGRPVRDLRRHRRRGDAAGGAHLRTVHARGDLPAGAGGRGDHRLDHRHLRGAHDDRQRRARALPGPRRSPACWPPRRSRRSPTG